MFNEVDSWRLLAGLGIFLFGMFLLEESVKNLAGRSFKRFIRNQTSTRLKAILSGSAVTALLQSSSAVSLMVLAFTGAGIMTMENAIGVILGSNIGTTATAWLVAMFGFKVDIESFALPLIGIGGLGVIFLGRSVKYSNISKLISGFGFLFMGLDYMKDSVSGLSNSFDINLISDQYLIVFVLAGFLFTAIMQSSSASIAIVLTALHAGLIDFTDGAAMIIGANIGTTTTVLLGALGGSQLKKRVAGSHFLFNVLAAIVGLALIYPFSLFADHIGFSQGTDAVLGIALYHTVFNVTGVLAFLPLTNLAVKLLHKAFPEKNVELAKYLHPGSINVSTAAIEAVKKEALSLQERSMRHNLGLFKIDEILVFTAGPEATDQTHDESGYRELKALQGEILKYGSNIYAGEIDEAESALLARYLHAARLSMYAAKQIHDVDSNLKELADADDRFSQIQVAEFRQKVTALYIELVKLFGLEDHVDQATIIHNIKKQVKANDSQLVQGMNENASSRQVSAERISDILMVNRAIYQSTKYILQAFKELLLTETESEILEEVT